MPAQQVVVRPSGVIVIGDVTMRLRRCSSGTLRPDCARSDVVLLRVWLDPGVASIAPSAFK
jgi:hypothetical protein